MEKKRSKSKQNIIDVAFEHLIINGYEGASLNTIAEAVGIRKASIYTHFKSKDELFLALLQDALDFELAYLSTCFSQDEHDHLPGEKFLHELQVRFQSVVTCKFLTRMAYVPPTHLIAPMNTAYKAYIKQLSALLTVKMAKIFQNPSQQALYIEAYLGIFDSLSAELLYDGSMYDRRLKAMLMLYRNSIAQDLSKIP